MRGSGPKSLKKFIPHDLAIGLHKGLGRLSGLYPAWNQAVGGELARHSRPIRYIDHCLVAETDSPVWAARLRLHQHEIIEALATHEAARGIRELKVCIVPTTTAVGPVTSPARPASPVSSRASATITRTAENVSDPELKNALLRLGKTTAAASHNK